jgi:isocitrate dehydrogenase
MKRKLPETIKEAAESILNDMTIKDQQNLLKLTNSEYNYLFEKLNHTISEDFKLYQGNEKLLKECQSRNDQTPAKAILDQTLKILLAYHKAFNIIAQKGLK